MPERYSDEHLRLLQQGIPVYPGDEALIAQIAGQARTDSRRYPDIRGAIAGDPMGGNVTPRFGMDTARQRSTNLGLPNAKRKVVEKIVDDPNTPNTITTTVEDEVPSEGVLNQIGTGLGKFYSDTIDNSIIGRGINAGLDAISPQGSSRSQDDIMMELY